MSSDYIPSKDTDLNEWVKRMCQYTESKTGGSNPDWTHIPKPEIEKLNTAYTDWYVPFAKTLKPHTPVDTLAKNNAKKALKAVVRAFVNQYLRYPPVTDEDRLAMGIPNHDTKPTPVPAPTSQAEADLVFPGIHLVELVKIRKAGILSDDPRSDHGVRIYYGILDAVNSKWRITSPPATGEDLSHSVFTCEKKMSFDFDGESGKTVYFCTRLGYQDRNERVSEKPTGQCYHTRLGYGNRRKGV